MSRFVGNYLTVLRVVVVIIPVSTGGAVWAQDPCLVAKLAPGDADVELGLGAGFGSSAAMDVDTIVIGASQDQERAEGSGAAYVFVRQGDDWIEQTKLIGSGAAFNDAFGSAVDVDGDRIIVGMPHSDPAGSDFGEAYIFQRSGVVWVEQARLIPSVSTYDDFFGRSVAISGDRAIVGAVGGRNEDLDIGAAFIFRWTGTDWVEEKRLVGPVPGARFGSDVAISGARVVVAASRDDGLCPGDMGCNSGKVHVYGHDGTDWLLEAMITPNDIAAADAFGTAVVVEGGTLVASSPHHTSANTFGAVYVFHFDGVNWIEEAELTNATSQAGDEFGHGLALDADRLLVAQLFGPAQLYRMVVAGWQQVNVVLEAGRVVDVSANEALVATRVYSFSNVRQCIPTVSEWGIIVLAILLTTGATLVLRRRGSVASHTHSENLSMMKRSKTQLRQL